MTLMTKMIVFHFNDLYTHLSDKFGLEYDEVEIIMQGGYDEEFENKVTQGVIYDNIPRNGYVSIPISERRMYLYEGEMQKKFVEEIRELSELDDEWATVLIKFDC